LVHSTYTKMLRQFKLCYYLLIGLCATWTTHACSDPGLASPNGTGQVTFDGFATPGPSAPSPGTWTYTISVAQNMFLSGYQMWTYFGLKTSTNISLESQSLPYAGCVLIFDPLPSNITSKYPDTKNGNCVPQLGNDCVNAFIEKMANISSTLSGNASGQTNKATTCGAFYNSIPDVCRGSGLTISNAYGEYLTLV
jgi:hypothetical protein